MMLAIGSLSNMYTDYQPTNSSRNNKEFQNFAKVCDFRLESYLMTVKWQNFMRNFATLASICIPTNADEVLVKLKMFSYEYHADTILNCAALSVSKAVKVFNFIKIIFHK